MPESRDRSSRPVDVSARFLRRRQVNGGGIAIFLDEPEDSVGTPFRWGETPMTDPHRHVAALALRGGGGAGRGGLRTPRATVGRGQGSQRRPSASVLPSWYPRTPLRDITAVVRRMMIFISLVIFVSTTLCSGIVLPLHRAYPPAHKGNLAVTLARDSVRQRTISNFSLFGSDDMFVAGLYYTILYLGTPSQGYAVDIDTGSEFMWVNCISCVGCPKNTDIGITLNVYNPSISSTASLVPCSHGCKYSIRYVDGSMTSGYKVTDQLQLPSMLPYGMSSHPITFGCSTMRSGLFSYYPHTVDGILGLGHGGSSVVSQLYSQGVTPRVFSHYLKGGDVGGGFLVFGEVVAPRVVYTPLLHSRHYSVRLHTIDINGQLLSIDSNRVKSNGIPGIVFDSGATYTYLLESDFYSFADAINKVASRFGSPTTVDGYLCYENISQAIPFPPITLMFDGGALMKLRPENYVLFKPLEDGSFMPCLGVMKVPDHGVPTLGDITLKDRLFIYDIHAHRMGWSEDYYNCSSSSYPVNFTYGSAPTRRYYGESGWNLLVTIFFLFLDWILIC